MAQGSRDTSAHDAAIRRQMKRTFDPRVIDGRGNLHGLFRLDYGRERLLRRNYKSPVLVTRTAGVSVSKVAAAHAGSHETAGFNVVAHAINDLIATGAEPLMFVPHLDIPNGDAAARAAIIKGLADGCVQAGCALLGVSSIDESQQSEPLIDADAAAAPAMHLTGFALGVVNENRVIDGSLIRPGDAILGLAGNDAPVPGDSAARIYARSIQRVVRYYRRKIAVVGMAHVTTRAEAALTPLLPEGLTAALDEPPEATTAFLLIVRPKYADSITRQLKRAKEQVHPLGAIAAAP